MSLPARAIYLDLLFQIYQYGGSIPPGRNQLIKLAMVMLEEVLTRRGRRKPSNCAALFRRDQIDKRVFVAVAAIAVPDRDRWR